MCRIFGRVHLNGTWSRNFICSIYLYVLSKPRYCERNPCEIDTTQVQQLCTFYVYDYDRIEIVGMYLDFTK